MKVIKLYPDENGLFKEYDDTYDITIHCESKEDRDAAMDKLKRMVNRWIPVSERLPETDDYILVSFANFNIPDIGRYEVDKNGDGAFYLGDEDTSYDSLDLFVNAWMPLPEPYND